MGGGPVSYLTAALLLADEQARFGVQPYGAAGQIVAMRVGGFTLQWDSIDQARAFLANASAALETEAARYQAEQGQA